MFNKLKQIKDLRGQAKKMQSALSQENVTLERSGVRIVMNGNMELTSVNISENLDKETLARVIKDLVNDAMKQTQKIMAKKMQEMGGFPGLG
ncbi:MAG TPA: YbaB/EbfC family nucleoid-associated protein [bacterium]|nr:YbaB/EbfC family nucleoid-associated protein [bacterium]HPT29707.1 YbaB/EbfC family nucleoid-associated protein [bacterium]